MRFRIRIYRVHDYDLMALQKSGAVKLSREMKRAIIAYYKGEYYKLDTRKLPKPPSDMPYVYSCIIDIHDDEAPGIIDWLLGMSYGYRNSCFKSIFRHYLMTPCIDLYRDDAWKEKSEPVPDSVPVRNLGKTKVFRKKKKLSSGSAWVDELAKESVSQEGDKNIKIEDIDKVLEDHETEEERESGKPALKETQKSTLNETHKAADTEEAQPEKSTAEPVKEADTEAEQRTVEPKKAPEQAKKDAGENDGFDAFESLLALQD